MPCLAMYFNLVYNNVQVEGNLIRNGISVAGFSWVVIQNTILMMLTLGIYYPWASVKMNAYKLNNMWVMAKDLDAFIFTEAQGQ